MMANDQLLIRDAKLLFRNFAGVKGTYNEPGDRNFCILLEPELAKGMERDGWNIKYLRALEEGDEPKPYVQVKVEYEKGRPPRCVLISSRGPSELGSEQVALIDAVDIERADVMLNGYHWKLKTGETGVKAYLKNIFVTAKEDELEREYAGIMGDLKPADDDPIDVED
jgi:hypothetical protein